MPHHDSAAHAKHDDHHDDWPRLGTGALRTQDEDLGLGHIVSVSTYTWVYFSLCLLTGITIWAAARV